jgi:hypothetical protein
MKKQGKDSSLRELIQVSLAWRSRILIALLVLLTPHTPGAEAAGYYNLGAFMRSSSVSYAGAVQGNSAYQSGGGSATVSFSSAQVLGDLNVVAIGIHNSTATVTGVSDSAGNTYTLAVGPTVGGITVSQYLYYAANIKAAAAGSNTVTVAFSAGVTSDIRIQEYSGVATTSPLDVATGTSSTTGSCDSGSATTTNANDLLVGATISAFNDNWGATAPAAIRVASATYYNSIEDEGATTAGSHHLGLTTTAGSEALQCVTQMAAFKLAKTWPSPTYGVVQSNLSTSPTTGSSLTVTYASAQAAGDLNVVVVGWNNATGSVSSITDSKGNTYTLAAGPIAGTSTSMAIYYAKNIVAATAGANTVTVTFSTTMNFPEVSAHEYSGLSTTSPLDQTGSATSSAVTFNYSAITTTFPNELVVFGVQTGSAAASTMIGSTLRFATPDGNIRSDAYLLTAGTYAFSGALSPPAADTAAVLATFH